MHKHEIELTNSTIPSDSVALFQLHVKTVTIQVGKGGPWLCSTRNRARTWPLRYRGQKMLEVAALHWPLRRRWEIGCSYLKWKVRWTQGSGGPGGSEGCRARHRALDNQVWVYSLPKCLRTGLFTDASPVRCSRHICSLESLSASGRPPASVCIRNLSVERNGFTYMQSDSSLWECLWMCCPPLLPGVIRDWKNQFTDAQTKKFNEDYEIHMADTSLSFHMHCKRQPMWSRREICFQNHHWLIWPNMRVFKRWPGRSSALNSWPIFWMNPVWCQLSSIYIHHFLLSLQSSVFRWMSGYQHVIYYLIHMYHFCSFYISYISSFCLLL